MAQLPVIVGFGGINSAGRSSGHHAYRRMVIEDLSPELSDRTFSALAALMQGENDRDSILRHTLVRKLESNLFDADAIRQNKAAKLFATSATPATMIIRQSQCQEWIGTYYR